MGNVKLAGIIGLFVLLINTLAVAQNRYFIQFRDKAGTPYSLQEPETFLTTRALSRRQREGIPVTEEDLPVSPSYLNALREAGLVIRYSLRWFNGAVVEAFPAQIASLDQPWISGTVFLAPGKAPVSSGRQRQTVNSKSQAATSQQLTMLGLSDMHNAGITGSGVLVAVFDAGFPGINTVPEFEDLLARIHPASYNFVSGTTQVFTRDSHGTHVVSIAGGENNPDYIGAAPDAEFLLCLTEDVDTEYRIEEYNWAAAAERADSLGVEIIQSSLGYTTFDDPDMNYSNDMLDGNTAFITKAAGLAGKRGILVVSSAGNEGNNSWGLISPPADAREVIAVANVNADGARSSSSSIGPSTDGRIKPDIAALGTGTVFQRPSGQNGSGSGTSYAAPLITGLLAGLRERFPDLPISRLREALTLAASSGAKPQNFTGYGIPNFQAAVNYLTFIQSESPWNIYPNPTTQGNFLIKPGNLEEAMTCNLLMYSSSGNLVLRKSLNFNWLNPVSEISLETLPAGLYLIELNSSDGSYHFRLVRE